MHVQAPLQFVRDYYDSVQRKNERYPDVAAFWLDALGAIDGDAVLNVGCGPMFYDNMKHFARPPACYVGLDINESSFDFLRHSDDPHLLEARKFAEQAGTRVEFVCADIFDCAERFENQFDCILGVGFFATFHGVMFDRLLALMHLALRPGGRLLKLTWHGPHRTEAETCDKLRYRYDNEHEPGPQELVEGFARAGFVLESQSIYDCPHGTVGWDAIQACQFLKSEESDAV